MTDPTSSQPLSGPLTIIRVEWCRGHTDGGVEPMVRVRRGDNPSERLAAEGLALNYRVVGPQARRCVGRTGTRPDEPAFVDCDNRAQSGSRLCVSCSVAEATFAAGLHHAHTRPRAELSAEAARHLAQPNALYLAVFRDGSVKVGTSTIGRRHLRWAEQGAWRVAQVATTSDGIIVRQLEDRVTNENGLAQSVGVGRKLTGMITPLDEADLDAVLDDWVAKVHPTIERFDPTIERMDERWTFPNSRTDGWNRLFAYPNQLAEGAHDLVIDRLCGRVAVVAKPGSGDRFAVDLGRLYGLELNLGDHRADDVLVQDRLF